MSTSLNGTDLVALAFGALNAVRITSYLPQIIALTRGAGTVRAILLLCWLTWAVANAATILHASINIRNIDFATIGTMGGVCCAVLLTVESTKQLLSCRKRG